MELPYSITIDLTKDDLKEGLKFVNKNSRVSKLGRRFIIIVYVLASFTGFSGFQETHGTIIAIILCIVTLLIMALIGLALFKIWMLIAIKSALPKSEKSGILGKHDFTINENYVVERTEVNESKFSWSSVPHVRKSENQIYLYQTEQSAHIFPFRAFESAEHFGSFYDLLNNLKQRAQPDDGING